MVERATIFGGEADAYDALRPRYPDEVIDLITNASPELVVDAGCGTGIAAAQVVERGVRVRGVEPDERMAQIARARGIEIDITPLEAWSPVACDVMYAAQAWHWIDPARGAQVAADAIRPGGRWLACWNYELDDRIEELCAPVYERLAPSLLKDRPATYLQNDPLPARIGAGFEAVGGFGPLEALRVEWTDHLDSEHFVDRLGSHSAHRLLDEGVRAQVRAALLEAVGAPARLEVRYVTVVLAATRAQRVTGSDRAGTGSGDAVFQAPPTAQSR